ncbi:hypothetical protein GUJ93_ZPchr0001g29785 [Zizania palustris]|uniref:C2H2-type domain-containing protein n=1 Tax=Zizania palustris TaxID=103762 RepID=A0A8J5S3W5_ZIZPA|nr:hypothetical protein GUJ93_ZPchr0001g29785 [Zizania palustris]
MRVHALRKHRELDEKQLVNCASIGKRGRKGNKAVIARFAPKDQFSNSVANVLAEVVTHQKATANHHSPRQPVAAPPQLLLLPQAAQGDQASGPPYRCMVEGCGRMYDKYQSLGGHAAGHANRVKQEATDLVVNSGNNDAKPERSTSASDDGGVSTTAASVVWEVFRCGNCRREFNSRQALHGQMRVHALRKHRELDEKQPVNCASTGKR